MAKGKGKRKREETDEEEPQEAGKGKGKGKRKREETPEEEEGYQVEVITAARVADVNLDDPWEYYVKWGGYDSSEDSWQPAENVAACKRLLDSFWNEVGVDNEDYEQGYTVTASEKWIRKERKRFKIDYDQIKEEERKQQERKERKKEKELNAKKAAKKEKLEKQKSRSASASHVRQNSQSSVSSYPAPPPASAPPPKKKAKLFVPSPEESDDDKPLAQLKKPSPQKKRKSPPKTGDDEKAKVQKTQGKTSASASTSSIKFKNFEPSNEGKKSAPPSRAPSSPPKPVRPSSPKNESNSKGKNPPSRPPTPEAAHLFSSSPSPATSPEITLKSLVEKPTRKPPARSISDSTHSRPQISINTKLPAPSSTISSVAPKAAAHPLPPPKPQTSSSIPPQRTVSLNPPSGSSGSGPPLLSGTPKLPSATPVFAAKPNKPPTPIIPSVKPTPTIPAAKPPSALPPPQRTASSSRGQGMPPPTPAAGSGSGIATKQRLGQNVTDLVIPRKSILAGMKIPKKKDSVTTPAVASGTTPRVTAAPPPKPPPRPEMDPLFDSPDDFNQVESPVDMLSEPNEQTILLPALSRRRPQPSSTSATPTDNSPSQVNTFLQSAMPPQLAAPLAPTVDSRDGPTSVRTLSSKPKIISSLRPIPKKWKWSGKLLMDVTDIKDEPSRTDHLCNVVLNELFPPTVEGPQINIMMTPVVESLHLLSFHDLVDMSEFLKTSGVRMDSAQPLQQLARLGPSTDKDAEPLKILARYMTKKNFVSLVPTYLDGDLVGHLLLFPPVMDVLRRMLKVPEDMVRSSSFIVALLPWKPLSQEARRPFGLLPPPSTKPRMPSEADWKKNMTKTQYQLGLRILKFPLDLHTWLSRSPKTYCIWPSEERKEDRDREIGYLTSILKECGAKRVDFKADLRAIFVHVGGLKRLREMPRLVERRSQLRGIHFYTFGTHETLHPEHWGIREIYPLGGVVTFTASALYEDPWGVVDKIKIINKHPLFTCYILPTVIGMAAKLCSPEEDPLAAFTRDEFVFDRLLKAIDDGELSVLRAPPLEQNATRTTDPATEWLREHWINRPLSSRHMLEFCLSAFSAKYSNIPKAEWTAAVEAEISEDLGLMQMQPNIMKQYRRYVVIKAETDKHVAADKDGFEWLASSDFSFHDEFPVQTLKTSCTA
ncbi:Chromo domain-containing protein [Mycena sanguinolenta]|uniref:Chromo domain-containing protein n=1 Tax=Mycena sanguinolenta TaxID=230812 RepID=A0A8H6XFU1_9AGAR|nr:Chromo domain-containing protein [Mycena sanguinolenta]